MTIEENFIPFEYDDKKLFLKITKPMNKDLEIYETYELTSPYPSEYNTFAKRSHHKFTTDDIPISEWKIRLTMQPDDVIFNTVTVTTQLYFNQESKTREDPRMHLKSRTPGLKMKRLNEVLVSGTFFPPVKSNKRDGKFILGKPSPIMVRPFKTLQDKLGPQMYLRLKMHTLNCDILG